FAIKGMDIFLIVCAKQAYRSIRWESKLQHHFHCCGFTRSVSAEQTINFSFWHMKIDLIDNGGCSVSLRKIFCFNDIIHIRFSFLWVVVPVFADHNFIIHEHCLKAKKPTVTMPTQYMSARKKLRHLSCQNLFSKGL